MPGTYRKERSRRRKVSHKGMPVWIRQGAGIIFAIACNISAPLVPPLWGIPLAIVAMILWICSLNPVEKWAISHFRTNPVSSIGSILLLIAVLTISSISVYRASNHLHQQHSSSTIRNPPAPTDNLQTHEKDAQKPAGIVGAHGSTEIDHSTVSGYETGIDLRPSEKGVVRDTRVTAPQSQTKPPAEPH